MSSSSPTGPALPPEYRAPGYDGYWADPASQGADRQSYGGYGADLQSYGRGTGAPTQGPDAVAAPPDSLPSPPAQSYGAAPYPYPAPSPEHYSTPAAPGQQYLGQPYPYPSPPYPGQPYPAQQRPEGLPQRPGVVGLAATLGATASLQWVGVLSYFWLLSTIGARQLGTSGVDGAIFHILNRFDDRMLDGLAWPLYLFPVASFVLSLLLLTRRAWARTAYTATGAAALVWAAFWLRHDLVWWLVPAGYIAVCVGVLWTASATRWYRWRAASDPAGELH